MVKVLFLLEKATRKNIAFPILQTILKKTFMSLGYYPEILLSDARNKRDEYRALLSKDIEPQDHKLKVAQQKLQKKEFTLSNIVKGWLILRENEVKAGKLKQDTYEDEC
ncbi:prophage integrase [Pasteurella multocida]|nr:prophage integrase [Pasteurella multocida]